MEEKGFASVVDLKEAEAIIVLVLDCPVGLGLKMESPSLGVGGGDLRELVCIGV